VWFLTRVVGPPTLLRQQVRQLHLSRAASAPARTSLPPRPCPTSSPASLPFFGIPRPGIASRLRSKALDRPQKDRLISLLPAECDRLGQQPSAQSLPAPFRHDQVPAQLGLRAPVRQDGHAADQSGPRARQSRVGSPVSQNARIRPAGPATYASNVWSNPYSRAYKLAMQADNTAPGRRPSSRSVSLTQSSHAQGYVRTAI